MLTQLINARILTPQGWLKDGSVLIRDNKILEVTNCDLAVIGAQLIDVKGMYVLPGGVEIHAHGGGGRDFMECTEDAFRTAVNTHMRYGTTSIFPTLSSSTVPMIEQAAETCTKLMQEKDSPILGLHLEGHYLNMAMAGGQMPENIKNPDPNEYIPIVENGIVSSDGMQLPSYRAPCSLANIFQPKAYWHQSPIHRLNSKTSAQPTKPDIRMPLISTMPCPDSTSVVNTSTKVQ